MSSTNDQFVLVTGATGFIGAHVVDTLLERGIRVRGATRSLAKGKAMIDSRPQYASRLEFVQIQDFENPGGLSEAVRGVNGVIHVASPFTYSTSNNEEELIKPAINGLRSLMEACLSNQYIKRVVLTSSFAAVVDIDRKAPPFFTYTADDWSPLTYDESIHPSTSAVVAYRDSKEFAELEAWKFVKERSPSFDLVTLCPPMTFGPVAHPVSRVDDLNETNMMLWKVATGEALPVARVPFWIDVRDLALAHVESLLRENIGGRRFTPAAPEPFSYGLAAKIIVDRAPELRQKVKLEDQEPDKSHGLDGQTAADELGLKYRSFRETVGDFISQALEMSAGSETAAQ